MSRTTACINRIKEQLDSVSGLDGIVADLLEVEEQHISKIIEIINKYFECATIFDYYGSQKEDEGEEFLDWIPQNVVERDWDGGHTNYTEYRCPRCGHTEAYKKKPYCSSCGLKMDM